MKPFLIAVCLLAAQAAHAQDALDPDESRALSGALAEAARENVETLSFEEFRDQTLYVPETGKYYVNGDIPIRNEKLLREFWERNIRARPDQIEGASPEFTVINVGGLDQLWNGAERLKLTYCVSTGFGGRYAEVVDAMADAAAAWEAAADIDFTHLAAMDMDCATGGDVLFDVRPVDVRGAFLAAAFFPNDPPRDRSLVIAPSAFRVASMPRLAGLSLTGILRHELGHVLGGRHEHTRPQAGTCFEDADWRPVTDYDALSVMHYPHCNGLADWSLNLTDSDRNGIACLYGPAAGFAFDPGQCHAPAGPAPRATVTEALQPGNIEAEAFMAVATIRPTPLTPMIVTMSGTGDPDLYVKIDGPALRSNFDCRPYDDGPDEVCDFEVPEGAQFVSIGVHGYSGGSFEISAEYSPLEEGN